MSKVFGVKCTDEQAARFEAAATRSGAKTVPEWLRGMATATVEDHDSIVASRHADREFHEASGLHSGIPSCCVAAFIDVTGIHKPGADYVLCAGCAASGRVVDLHLCVESCVPFLKAIGMDDVRIQRIISNNQEFGDLAMQITDDMVIDITAAIKGDDTASIGGFITEAVREKLSRVSDPVVRQDILRDGTVRDVTQSQMDAATPIPVLRSIKTGAGTAILLSDGTLTDGGFNPDTGEMLGKTENGWRVLSEGDWTQSLDGTWTAYQAPKRGDILSIHGTPVVNPPTDFVLKEDIKEVDGELSAELAEALEHGEFTVVEEMSREEFKRRYPPPVVEWPEDPNSIAKITSDVPLYRSGPVAAEILTYEPSPILQSWASQFAAWKAAGEYGAQLMADATEHIKFPKGFRELPERKQIAWLDEKHPLVKS